MAKNYTLMDKEAIDELCKAVRESYSISEAIDDDNLATNSTFSSVKIDNLFKENTTENKEYTDQKISKSISENIDDTLSKSGFSADSAVVGEKIDEINSNIDTLTTETNQNKTDISNNKNDISQLFDITKGGNTVTGESSYTLDDAVDYPLLGLNLYGKSVQDGTPSPDNPIDIVSVGDNGSAEITACGKNLFPWNDYTKGIWSRHHLEYVTRTIYENEIELNINLPSGNAGIYIPSEYLAKPIFDRYDGMMITSSFEMKSSVPLHASACGFEGSTSSFDITTEWKRYSVSKPYNKEKNNSFTFYTMQTGEVTWNIRNIQIELGDTATEYKPYIGNTAAITSAMPLCGIPVDSVGNYTDKNGQQWVCDELVYNADGTGEIVKRTAKIDSYDGETITTPYISTTGDLTTGATVIYALDTPQEITLTSSEISAFMELQTYSGESSITNSDNADMDVKYCTNKNLSECVIPITTALQAQIDELKSAVLSLGGNV